MKRDFERIRGLIWAVALLIVMLNIYAYYSVWIRLDIEYIRLLPDSFFAQQRIPLNSERR